MTQALYVASARASGNGNCSLHKLNADDGSILWSRDTGNTARGLALNAAETAVYVGGVKDTTTSKTTWKYDKDGNQIWAANQDNIVYGVTLDDNENVYTCGLVSAAGYETNKYDSAGNEDTGWRKQIFNSYNFSVCRDADGYLYFSGDPTNVGGNVAKYDASGTQQWRSLLHGGSTSFAYQVVVDPSGNIIVVGARYSSSVTTEKYNSSKTLQWSKDHGGSVFCVATDASGNIYTGGAVASSITTRKYNSSGTQQWTANHGAPVRAIAVDIDGNVYTAGDPSGVNEIRKYNSAGTLQWSQDLGAACYALAVGRPTVSVAIPGLPDAESLGTLDGYNFITALGFPDPESLGELEFTLPPLPPDPLLFTLPPQSIYRCLIVDATGGLAIPLASFQCRRRAGESTWLSVVCPYYSESLRAAITARVGAALVIRAGVRSAVGVETLGDFLQSVLTDYEYNRTPWGASLTLTGRVVPSAHTAQSRALVGIQTRSVDEQGRKQVRCAVDPLLRPGDTAAALDWSFEVGAILYFIGATDAWMQVTESLS